jgi:hypothetical protein
VAGGVWRFLHSVFVLPETEYILTHSINPGTSWQQFHFGEAHAHLWMLREEVGIGKRVA